MFVTAARMVEVNLLQGRNDGTGFTTSQEKCKHRTCRRDKQHWRDQRQQDRRDTRLSLRQTNNLTVIEGHGAIQHNLVECGAWAFRGTEAVLKCRGNLGTIAMVGQHGGRCLVVVGNRAVFVDQRNAQVLTIEAAQECDRLLLFV